MSVAAVNHLACFIERVPPDVRLAPRLHEWAELRLAGWDVTVLLGGRGVVALGWLPAGAVA